LIAKIVAAVTGCHWPLVRVRVYVLSVGVCDLRRVILEFSMDIKTRVEEAAEATKRGDVMLAEQIYHEILSNDAGTNESALREQETALIQLGTIYRDQRLVPGRINC
jgi:hypothetical protein